MSDENAPLSLAQKIDVLFEYGETRGLNITYQAIEDATGEAYTNILKIRKGANRNPGFRVIENIARYFDVDLNYFQCETETECRNYLDNINADSVSDEILRLRAHSISPEALRTIDSMIKYVQQAEGMNPSNSGNNQVD